MARKKRVSTVMEELNMKPAMNLILILIPLLLSSMESVKIAVVNVATPQIGPSSVANPPSDTPEDKPLKLTIALTDRGITVFAREQVVENKDDPLGPTILKKDGEEEDATGKMVNAKVYDLDKLVEIVSDIKDANPAEENIIITAEPNIKFKYIMKIMDATRETKVGDKTKKLFPNVVLSAGIA
ncbi:MAG TPA: biopolymer transporter ExbD [bacterium]|nr:biopolymer transporter ExbD [bacterium]HPY14126.1 biopolymer transporter ExbD [bacterium]HQB08525.1 biopolymer transporter ExbD [bacterium]